jgi:two-component system, cell cycle response regulator
MNSHDRELVRHLEARILLLLEGQLPREQDIVAEKDSELEPLAGAVTMLVESVKEAHDFLQCLSQGNLDVEPPSRNQFIAPFKRLHAHLRHLTWQTQQIAAGDLDQRVEFLGAFSVAFNSLIDALREKRAAEERIRFLSIHDTLTGLYNRAYFQDEMARLERGRHFPVSMIVADIDGLKEVNDTAGHATGDLMIRGASRILQKGIRGEDVIARIGGDEFVVILPDTDEAAADLVMTRMREAETSYKERHAIFAVRISLGCATAHEHSSLDEIFRLADRRMYENKASRKKTH